jgi:hypothetical protein
MPESTPSPKPTGKPIEREVPRPVRYFTNGFVFRKLNLRERFKILFGYNLGLEVHIASEHRPGRVQPIVNVRLTPYSDGQTAMEDAKRATLQESAAREATLAAARKLKPASEEK